MNRMFDVVVVHYGEIALKGKNRPYFENALVRNAGLALNGVGHGGVKKISGRLLVLLNRKSNIELIRERLSKVFGIEHFSFAFNANLDVNSISRKALAEMKNRKFKSFRVDTKRSNKGFKLNSQQVNEKVGGILWKKTRKKVDLTRPDLTVFVEILEKNAFVYFEKIPGPGGLPVGVSGSVASLISSGIDSPVAAYKAMKRGLKVIFVHFHSYPYTNKASISKAIRIVELLNKYQYSSNLYMVPFSQIQNEIVGKTPSSLRVILYRRFMIRLAEEIAKKHNAKALVTGESMGQVASQTLDNIFVIDQVSKIPIFRPLIGEDKKDIINSARQIGTYSISIEPHDDCCSLFLPKRPETHARLEEVLKEEKRIRVKRLVKQALKNAELKYIKW